LETAAARCALQALDALAAKYEALDKDEELPVCGFFAPPGTPNAAIDPFAAALAKVIAVQDVKDRLTAMALSVGFMNQALFTTRERAYTTAWSRIIKARGIQPQ
jgi:tripartite-type tricarboxylate transporter receptor subunit TctC